MLTHKELLFYLFFFLLAGLNLKDLGLASTKEKKRREKNCSLSFPVPRTFILVTMCGSATRRNRKCRKVWMNRRLAGCQGMKFPRFACLRFPSPFYALTRCTLPGSWSHKKEKRIQRNLWIMSRQSASAKRPVSVSFFSLSGSVSGEHWAWEKKEIRYADRDWHLSKSIARCDSSSRMNECACICMDR